METSENTSLWTGPICIWSEAYMSDETAVLGESVLKQGSQLIFWTVKRIVVKIFRMRNAAKPTSKLTTNSLWTSDTNIYNIFKTCILET